LLKSKYLEENYLFKRKTIINLH